MDVTGQSLFIPDHVPEASHFSAGITEHNKPKGVEPTSLPTYFFFLCGIGILMARVRQMPTTAERGGTTAGPARKGKQISERASVGITVN